MLIIWLQGIWLPLHGFSYEDTPLWAGIYLLPVTIGFLIAGPISGALSDRFGARGVRDRRPAAGRCDLHRAAAHPGELRVLAVRRHHRPERHRVRPVQRAEPHVDHEQCARDPSAGPHPGWPAPP